MAKTCKFCGKEILGEPYRTTPNSRTYYCNENCYLMQMAKKNTNHSFKPPEGTERRDFTDWLLDNVYYPEGFGKRDVNWQIVMKQYKNLIENNPGWTYETVKYIIWYEKEILGLSLITKESHWSPFSLVDFHAKEAEDFWKECDRINQSIENFDFDDTTRVIKGNGRKKPKKLLEF